MPSNSLTLMLAGFILWLGSMGLCSAVEEPVVKSAPTVEDIKKQIDGLKSWQKDINQKLAVIRKKFDQEDQEIVAAKKTADDAKKISDEKKKAYEEKMSAKLAAHPEGSDLVKRSAELKSKLADLERQLKEAAKAQKTSP